MPRVTVVRCLALLHEDRGETRFSYPHAAILGCRSVDKANTDPLLPLCNKQKQKGTPHAEIREHREFRL